MRARRFAWLLPMAALVVLRPSPVKGARAHASGVDLSALRVRDGVATAPTPGGPATLSLDVELQRTAEQLLSRANPVEGGALMIDTRTGRVLVWAERSAKNRPVLGSARWPSASVFKLVTSAALLELGGVPLSTEVCYRGGQRRIDRRHLDAPRAPDHCSTFHDALGHSRNAVFAQLATHQLMRDDLVKMAGRLGFDRRVPFDAPVLVGSVEVPYDDLGFARTAAGFGRSTLSPLGAAWLSYVVASGGTAPRIRIVERQGELEAPPGRESVGRVLASSTAFALTRMMEVTVKEGTSRDVFHDADGRAFLGNIRVAGKTGTLQPDATESTTSWFTGFAPSRRPAVVVTVLLQNGGVWRKKANEVARDLLRAYFARRGFRGVSDPLGAQHVAAR